MNRQLSNLSRASEKSNARVANIYKPGRLSPSPFFRLNNSMSVKSSAGRKKRSTRNNNLIKYSSEKLWDNYTSFPLKKRDKDKSVKPNANIQVRFNSDTKNLKIIGVKSRNKEKIHGNNSARVIEPSNSQAQKDLNANRASAKSGLFPTVQRNSRDISSQYQDFQSVFKLNKKSLSIK
mmetsp:Transcript_35240/g.40690  ORF Transcript_35240/g.40690 Transcript_35240/m.40690 type:complete len:178 (-) Transcript_35240:751-1284(-)